VDTTCDRAKKHKMFKGFFKGNGEEREPGAKFDTPGSPSVSSQASVNQSDRSNVSITEMSVRGKSSLARLLGIRWVCRVDQNTFFRDKLGAFGSFGYASKKAVSAATVTNENQLGTRWRPRIMVISTCSIVLFKNKKNDADRPAVDSAFASDDDLSKLIAKTGDVKISIPFEDIHYITKNEGVKDCIHIRTSQVNGDIQNLAVRVSSESECDMLMGVLEDARAAFQTALRTLNGGHFERSKQLFTVLQVTKKDVEEESTESIVQGVSIFRKTIFVGKVESNEAINVYLSHPLQRGLHRVVINHSCLEELASKNEKSWVAGDLMVLNGDDAVASVVTRAEHVNPASPESNGNGMGDSDNGSSDTEFEDIQYSSESMSLRVLVTFEDHELYPIAKDSMNENETLKTDQSNQSGVHVPINAVVVFFLCMLGAGLALPQYLDAEKIVAVAAIGVSTCFLYYVYSVRSGSKQSESILDSTESNKNSTQRLYSIKLYDAQLGLVDQLKAEEVEEEDGQISLSEDNESNEGKLGHLRGIDGVIAALDVSRLEGQMTEDDLPYNWLIAVNDDRKEALRRWIDSLEWRKTADVETILTKPQPHFFTIKTLWPQYFVGVEKEGNLVTIEKFKGLDTICKGMKKQGVSPDDFASHCVFLNEYWIKKKVASHGKLIKILDVSGLAFGLSLSIVIRYFSRMNQDMQQYPEILNRCYIVNVKEAGSAFRFIFRLLPRFLEQRTFEKIIEVKDVNSPDNPLFKIMDRDQLPVELGGTFSGKLRELDLEEQAADYARELNRKCGVSWKNDWKEDQNS